MQNQLVEQFLSVKINSATATIIADSIGTVPPFAHGLGEQSSICTENNTFNYR